MKCDKFSGFSFLPGGDDISSLHACGHLPFRGIGPEDRSRQGLSDVIVRKLCHIRSHRRCYYVEPVGGCLATEYVHADGGRRFAKTNDMATRAGKHRNLYSTQYFRKKKKWRVRGIS